MILGTDRITTLFGIQYPIIQGGMVWCSGWRLASAVSNCGGLGLLGAGSMRPDILREHITKMKLATQKPWGVNVPLLYPELDELFAILVEEKVKIVFTSAGSPAKYTKFLKENGIMVVHVIANSKFAKKCEEAGVDAIVAEGFEAGGHNGREETTTLALIPEIRKYCTLPLIAAGGIGSGQSIVAALALGAEGVQIGSLFAAASESSAHQLFKEYVINSQEGGTMLSLKKLSPTRLLKNSFFEQVQEAENRGASAEEIKILLGKGRAKKGMFEGNLEEGELEIGQVASSINSIKSVEEIFNTLLSEYNTTLNRLSSLKPL